VAWKREKEGVRERERDRARKREKEEGSREEDQERGKDSRRCIVGLAGLLVEEGA